MSILSLEFLVFAGAAVLLYYLLPLNVRWIALLCASAVFAALSGWYSSAFTARALTARPSCIPNSERR